jgi:hypothetical protein
MPADRLPSVLIDLAIVELVADPSAATVAAYRRLSTRLDAIPEGAR